MPNKKITGADDTQISRDNLLTEFMERMLGLEPGTYYVTDESMLSDFASCGMPETEIEYSSLNELYAAWDKWIMAQIQQTYGITLSTTGIYLLYLMERIRQQQTSH